ncbi:hypothetical protein [Aureimonas endophytica]|uniref:hypothetical protein n=1 Tax=Aureimonas endophytica TaxID=2027858 RepID=UPI0016676B67|nr:hypothetical protein [Aureimonas endophytica]
MSDLDFMCVLLRELDRRKAGGFAQPFQGGGGRGEGLGMEGRVLAAVHEEEQEGERRDRLPGQRPRDALGRVVSLPVEKVHRPDHPSVGDRRDVQVGLEAEGPDLLPVEEDLGDLLDRRGGEGLLSGQHRLEIAVAVEPLEIADRIGLRVFREDPARAHGRQVVDGGRQQTAAGIALQASLEMGEEPRRGMRPRHDALQFGGIVGPLHRGRPVRLSTVSRGRRPRRYPAFDDARLRRVRRR